MEDTPRLLAAILVLFLLTHGTPAKPIFSARLIHRFSGEAQNFLDLKDRWNSEWPDKSSSGHIRVLLGSDLTRQRLRLGAQDQRLVASDGGQTFDYGNEMGWLHYTWIDLGTPNSSFLVALDTGSDISWVPCDCTECAPLISSNYNIPDIELREYNPSASNSSKQVPCSHGLCKMGPNCKNPKGHCPYTVNYLSSDTSTSGFLFEDLLHLASFDGNTNQSSVQATIIIGCGSKQSGAYLNGIAPDGLLALGPGDISVPSLLAKSGLIPRSFSFCYDKSYSGRLYFGDQGPASQRSTSFIKLNGNLAAYVVEIEGYCVGGTCLKQTGLKVQVDTGSSFTFLPSKSYDQIISEFDRQANATKFPVENEYKYCYMASSLEGPNIPSIKLVFPMNQSLVVESPMFHVVDDQGPKRCIGLFPIDEDIGIIGQNFLMGYRMVFDWEKLMMGWSKSNCEEDNGDGNEAQYMPPPPSDVSSNPLPTNEQQKNPRGLAVAPAVAGIAPPKPSAASNPSLPHQNGIITLLLLLWTAIPHT